LYAVCAAEKNDGNGQRIKMLAAAVKILVLNEEIHPKHRLRS